MIRFQQPSPAKSLRAGLVLIITGTLCILGMPASLFMPVHAQAAEKTYRIRFVEIVENDAFAAMETGFKQRLERLGFTHVEYEIRNAQGDASILNQIASQLKNDNFDLVVPIGTPATQACANAGFPFLPFPSLRPIRWEPAWSALWIILTRALPAPPTRLR